MNDAERDRSIETLLRQGQAADLPSSDRCLDAEVLAAWMDEGLSADARVAAEKHAVGCARCQALLASMARTDPGRDVSPPWYAFTAKWVLPVAAVVTALVVWIS